MTFDQAPAPVLSFTEHDHVYSVDSKPKPGVTTILRGTGLSSSYAFARDIHKTRGTAVHDGSMIVDLGGTPEVNLTGWRSTDPEYIKVAGEIPYYWFAFGQGKERIGFQGRIWEVPFIDPVRGYGGKLDFAGDCRDEFWLTDIKSGSMPFSVCVQLAAYRDLITKGRPVKLDHPGLPWLTDLLASKQTILHKALRLEKTGRWTLYSSTTKDESFDSPKWTTAWRSALYLWNNVPDHEYSVLDDSGKEHTESRLSDLKWTAETIKERLIGPVYDTAMRSGENLWNLRSQYNLLPKESHGRP